ncbi:MAG: putative DNA binding domain-containing protein [Clostridia bacterium]|nr:putative DNA binding domain-containing protein [Clostridia bacterium]
MKESRSLEFKQEITSTFLKTVSAFANFGNGTILFGVDDQGKPTGISDPKSACLDLENRINDSIHPKPDYTLSIDSQTKVIRLEVAEGRYKPYLYKGKAYRRSDTATVEADQVELKRLTLEGENLYYESLPCGENTLQFHYLGKKLKEILGIDEVSNDVLRTLGLIGQNRKYTIAAALFADQNSFSGIDAVRFGNSISEILDRGTYAGMSVLQQYDCAVEMFRRYYQYEKIAGIQRETIETVPETAFREAVANALVHRTWDIDAHIRLLMHPDRVEIISPGSLPRGITEDEYLNGFISILRNPTIGNIFFRLHYIEMFGTGIRRIRDAYSAFSVQPSFRVTDNSVCIILPRTDSVIAATSDQWKILELAASGLRLSSNEIAESLGWSKAKTIRLLTSMQEAGMLRRYGAGRGTKYGRA